LKNHLIITDHHRPKRFQVVFVDTWYIRLGKRENELKPIRRAKRHVGWEIDFDTTGVKIRQISVTNRGKWRWQC
jgi:hypothetical protein